MPSLLILLFVVIGGVAAISVKLALLLVGLMVVACALVALAGRPAPGAAQASGSRRLQQPRNPVDDRWKDRPVQLSDPEVPASIREHVRLLVRPGDTLWRCPRRRAPRGVLGHFGIGQRRVHIEWWLMDAEGDLIDAFWEI